MHGGAVTLARRLREDLSLSEVQIPDLILTTDMLDVTTFLALLRKTLPDVPIVLYMHENQLTYPLPHNPDSGPMRRQRGERDLHYVFVNYSSMLAADRVLFNSRYHRHSLLMALPRFLNRFPEYQELGTVNSLHEKSSVLPVGLDLATLQEPHGPPAAALHDNRRQEAPLILWNQRWEYDKNPALFFTALYIMQKEGIPFRLALCGERFSRAPRAFDEARERLSNQIVHEGYATRDDYRRLLWEAELTISTARHEFFGISVLETIACQTFPILPFSLSYPELLPPSFHDLCLYEDEEGLLERLRWALTHRDEAIQQARRLAPFVTRFSWQQVAQDYDAFFLQLYTP